MCVCVCVCVCVQTAAFCLQTPLKIVTCLCEDFQVYCECVGVLFTANRFNAELLQVNPLFTHVHVDWTNSWQPYNRAGYPMLPYMGNRPIC